MSVLSVTRKRYRKKESFPDFKCCSGISLVALRIEMGLFYLKLPSAAKKVDERSVSMELCRNDNDEE
jgi:hypothetical protein